jgi:transcriptional regulator with XRE-family HTH domain
MDIFERRRANLRLLLTKISQAELARRSGVAPSYISRALKEPGEDGYKNLGEVTARKLEAGAKRIEGSLDLMPTAFELVIANASSAMAAPALGNDVEIRQFDASGMGSGRLLLEGQPGVIRSWHVDQDWLRLNVHNYTAVQNLCILTGFDPSMRPMFNPGDPLLVDRGVKSVDTDAVYFFRVAEHGYIKALQRIPTSEGTKLRAKSKNPDYDPFDIDLKAMDFEVLGKVLTVWKSEQF